MPEPDDDDDADDDDADDGGDEAPKLSPAGRSRTASGEISISVPREIVPETSDPEITITAEEPTSPGLRMPRKRRSDPPELADRGGEIAAREDGPTTITEEPRVVIDLQMLDPERQKPFETSGEIALPRTRAMSARMAAMPQPVEDEPSVRVELLDEPAVIHDARKGIESIIVDDDDDDGGGDESQPILLERPRTAPPVAAAPAVPEPPDDDAAGDETDVVVLLETARRPKTTSERRLARRTQLGLGAVGHGERSARDTEVGGLPPGADAVASQVIIIPPEAGTVVSPAAADQTIVTNAVPDYALLDDDGDLAPPPAGSDNTGIPEATRVDETAKTIEPAPPSPSLSLSPTLPSPSPGPRASAKPSSPPTLIERGKAVLLDKPIEPDADDVTKPIDLPDPTTRRVKPDDRDDDDDGRSTDAYDAIAAPPEPAPAPAKRPEPESSVDDGWGPPGTTIPPPFLRAIDDSQPVDRIPISDEDSAPLMVAPATRSLSPSTSPADAAMFARDLETAATRLVQVLRDIDQARGRDEVIYNLIAHLAETHNRAAFFAVRNGEVSVFSVRAPTVLQPRLTMRLDDPSTFQDVVGTRLPYRGPVVDEPTRAFLNGLLGSAPAEMLIIPVAVRDRVVGVLYADGRRRHTFDDHYAIAARAAGLALERIIKQKGKGGTEPPP